MPAAGGWAYWAMLVVLSLLSATFQLRVSKRVLYHEARTFSGYCCLIILSPCCFGAAATLLVHCSCCTYSQQHCAADVQPTAQSYVMLALCTFQFPYLWWLTVRPQPAVTVST